MNGKQMEFPAYNIFFRQAGRWTLHGEPIIGKSYIEAENIAVGILFGKPLTEAVRIYGIFNCQQTFIKEIAKGDFNHKSEEDKMRSAIEKAIEYCDEAKSDGFFGGSAILTIEKMRKVLSEAIETTKDVLGREKKGI